MRITEMATTRSDAIETCINLSKKFVEHFKKGYAEGVTSPTFHHHCSEMQAWWEDAEKIILKTNNKKVSKTNLMDWFFTMGSTPEEFLDDETMIDVYNDFIIEVLDKRETANIEGILRNILLRYGVG